MNSLFEIVSSKIVLSLAKCVSLAGPAIVQIFRFRGRVLKLQGSPALGMV